jgi:hypothetical protein
MAGQGSVDGKDKGTQNGISTYRHTSQIDTIILTSKRYC